MNAEPIVSIITPTYNHERHIARCVESVIEQTYENWEMIIVDDGSSDGTEDIIRSFSDPRLVYIRQDHVGPYRMSETYNRALAAANGTLIAVLEGDDMWPPYKLERQVPLLELDDIAIGSFGRALLIDAEGNPRGLYPRPRITGRYVRTDNMLRRESRVQPVTLLVRRKALEAIGGFQHADSFPAVDRPTLLQLSLLGPLRYDDLVLGLWRIHGAQVSSNNPLNLVSLNISRQFLRELPEAQRAKVNVSLSDLETAYRPYLADHFWSSSRTAAEGHRWRDARRELLAMLRYGGPFRKLEAAVALVCVVVHLDVDQLVTKLSMSSPGRWLVRHHNSMARTVDPRILSTVLSSNGEIPHGLD